MHEADLIQILRLVNTAVMAVFVMAASFFMFVWCLILWEKINKYFSLHFAYKLGSWNHILVNVEDEMWFHILMKFGNDIPFRKHVNAGASSLHTAVLELIRMIKYRVSLGE